MDPIWSQKSSINRDFSVLSGVIVFIALLTSLWVAYEAFVDESHRITTQLEAEAQRIDRAFAQEIDRATYLLDSIGRQILQNDLKERTAIAQTLRAFDNSSDYYSLFLWVNEDLQAITSSRQGVLDSPVDLSDRPYIQRAKAQPFRVQVGAPTQGRISERLVIPLGMGLTDYTGRYIGTITLSIDLQNLTRHVKDFVHAEQVGFAILNNNLDPMATDELGRHALQSETALRNISDNSNIQQSSHLLTRPSLFSNGRIFSYLYHGQSQSSYHILTTYESNYSTLRSLILPRMVQLLLVAAFLVSLLWLVRFRVIYPVQGLAEAGGEIARGQTNVDLPKSGPMEIMQLSRHLQSIIAYIAERKRIEDDLLAKVLGLKAAKETAEISDQAKMQILQLLKPEIFPALEDIGEISTLLVEQAEQGTAEDNAMLLEQLEHASIHLQDVTQEIFDLPRTANANMLASRKPVDVGQLVHRCVSLLGDTLEREEVNISVRLQGDLPKLNINELHLMHVIMHLIVACVSAIPAGGELTIEAALEETTEGTEFAIMFNDNATGLDTQHIATLWRSNQPNSRLNAQVAAKTPTSDASLEDMDAIILTKKIITLHDGRMTVQNPPDKEAVITIHFRQ